MLELRTSVDSEESLKGVEKRCVTNEALGRESPLSRTKSVGWVRKVVETAGQESLAARRLQTVEVEGKEGRTEAAIDNEATKQLERIRLAQAVVLA